MSNSRHDRPGFPEFVPSITDMLLIETSATCDESHLGHSQPFAMSNSRRSRYRLCLIEINTHWATTKKEINTLNSN